MTLLGADTDALDKDASAMTKAAGVCDDVCKACEAIVAASFFLGPFGAAFVHYLETVVIPWLKKTSAALQALAKLLNVHADAQRQASDASSLTSGTTSTLPSFVSTLTALAGPFVPGLGAAGTIVSALTGPASSTTAEKPGEAPSLTPGLRDDSSGFGAQLDKDRLQKLTGADESPWHVAVPVQHDGFDASLLHKEGANWDLKLGEAKGAEALWGGIDDKGRPQVGGAASLDLNAVDVTGHKTWELPGGSDATLQNQTTIGAHAKLTAQASYDSATASGSASYGVDAFAGAQNTTSAELTTRWVSDKIEGTVQYGAGYANLGSVEFAPGEVKLHVAEGLAWGPGAKVANTVDVHYDHILADLGSLFGGSAQPEPKR